MPSWTFVQPSPLGDVRAAYELTADGLQYRCDSPAASRRETLRWDAMAEAGTATLDLPEGDGPGMPPWMPGRLEWLVVARTGGAARGFMAPLPASDARDAIVHAVRQQMGGRWIGERMPLQSVRRRFRLAGGGGTLKVIGLALSVLAVLLVLLVAAFFVSALCLLPAGIVAGGWLGHRGLDALRDAKRAAGLRVTRIAQAAGGLVKLQGRAVADAPVRAAVSGRACAWWDVTVEIWSESSEGSSWGTVLARHGGSTDVLVIDDGSGRVPVWLRDADLLLQEHTWESGGSGRQPLPEGGLALLRGTGYAWDGAARLRVRETRMEANADVVVVGTLDEARRLPADGQERGPARLARALRATDWREAALRRVPAALRTPVVVAFGYLHMLFSLSRGGARTQRPGDAPPPSLPPSARVVWKGRGGHALIVSDRTPTDALAQWRKHALWSLGIGATLCCFCLYQLAQAF
jgi:hypothetical protein